MNTYPTCIKPQVTREPDGRISVFIGGAHKALPHEAAASLFQQLGEALRTPYSESVALFAAEVLRHHRGDGGSEVGDVDGADLQELALAHGLLEPFEVKASCGFNCACEEGDRCYRHTPLAGALLALIETADALAEVRL